jgi:hypothetical protein
MFPALPGGFEARWCRLQTNWSTRVPWPGGKGGNGVGGAVLASLLSSLELSCGLGWVACTGLTGMDAETLETFMMWNPEGPLHAAWRGGAKAS